MKKPIIVVAPPTPNPGECSQIRGLANCLSEKNENTYQVKFSTTADVFFENIASKQLKLSEYEDYKSFKNDVSLCLDNYFSKHALIPGYFVMAYTQGDNQNAALNVDAMCRAVKEYYKKHHLGKVTTVILTSTLYDYKYVDAVHVPNHLVSEEEMNEILSDERKNKKVFISRGIIHNMSKSLIKQKQSEEKTAKELNKFDNDKPKIVFCMGGGVKGPEIKFDLELAEKLYEKGKELVSKGYDVIYTSGSRTPSEICDYMYEKSVENQNIHFYNGKVLVSNDDDKHSNNWRTYSGKYEKAFRQQLADVGNIYPGILGVKNTVVVHTYDSFASCETAGSEIPTAIYRDFFIDKSIRPDCHRLADYLINQGYVIDFKDFDGSIEPDELAVRVLPKVNDLFSLIVKEIHEG